MRPMPEDLPQGLATLWGLREKPQRRSGLSIDAVVEAAIALADEDGLAAVSMARVAKRLGFTTMALYRHVESKDALLLLMVNQAAAAPPPPVEGEAWRPALERWCSALRDGLARHPWVLDIPIGGPPATPAQIAWMEGGFRALEHTGLSEQEKGAVVLMLNGQVFWEARVAVELGRSGGTIEMSAAFIDRVTDGDRFPAVRRALDAGIFEDDSAEQDLAFGVKLALDGVERLVEARS
jgi:AcrR family transcriptional regulator